MPSGNFDFLKTDPQFASFAPAAVVAEQALAVDPATCALACRRALEFAVKWLYSVDKSLVPPVQDQLVNLMCTPEFRDFLDDADSRLWQRLDYIRKLGNTAAHSQTGINRQVAVTALRHLHDFLDFVACCYERGHQTAHFDPALLPSPAARETPPPPEPEPAVDLAALLAENQALRDELTQRRKEQQTRYIPPPEPTEFETRRAYIDAMLLDAGWTEGKDWKNEVVLSGMPNKSGQGFADYVLFGDDGRPLALIEAKKTCVDLAAGRQQAKLYADILEKRHGRRPVIFLSNGFETRIDDGFYPERPVAALYAKRDLEKLFNLKTQRGNLADATVSASIAGRYYQQAAVKAVCESLAARRRRALLVMATGSGKTRTVMALCDLLLRCGWVKNILFLADRNALVTQAKRAFASLLPNLSASNLCEDKDKPSAHAIFSTYQTMMTRIDSAADEAGRLFTCGHFDLVICDEAHRSIYNKYRDIFSWFDAPLIGLTATPKDEIDRNTYSIFGLENGMPTFGYDLAQAVQDKYLVNFTSIETRLKFLEQGIAYDELTEEEKADFEKTFANENGKMPERIEASALNSWLFNEDTIRRVLDQLMSRGLKIDYGETLGKTIIFAKNHEHAEKILEVFNRNYPHLPGQAQVIDNSTSYAQSAIDAFADPNALPRIAISVDMLDTGIDVPEILNLVFFKKVLSKAKFWQMIGRGTRLCPGLLDGADKTGFYIFDFCGNFAFFRMGEGKDMPAAPTLQAALFSLKARLVFKLQDMAFQTDALRAFRARLVTEVLDKIRALNRDSFAVQQHLRFVDCFSREERWQALTPEDLPILDAEIAPLILPDADEPSALRFDALLYGIELAHLAGQDHSKAWRDVQRRVTALQEVASIPEVVAQKDLLTRIVQGAWPAEASAGPGLGMAVFESIRAGLRELMKYLPKNRHRYDTNFSDEIMGVTWTTGESGGEYLADYRERAEAYIREHQDHPVIAKLKGNQPLTAADLALLEQLLWKDLGSREDYAQAYGQKPLGEFVRGLVGLEINAAKAAFARFLNDTSLDSRQIWFVNRIVEYIVQNGMMLDRSVLMEEPFSNDQISFAKIFDDEIWQNILSAIDEVNGNMAAAEPE